MMLQTISPNIYVVSITLGFIVVLELISVSKSISPKHRRTDRRQWKKIDYELRFSLADKIPFHKDRKLSNYSFEMTRIQIMNLLIEYMLGFITFTAFSVSGRNFFLEPPTSMIEYMATGVVILSIILWLTLPFITIGEYDLIFSEGIYPYSLICHIFGTTIVIGILATSAIYIHPHVGNQGIDVMGYDRYSAAFASSLMFAILVFIIRSASFHSRLMKEMTAAKEHQSDTEQQELNDFLE